MIHELIALLENSLRWLVDSDLPLDASGAVLSEAWERIADRLRSEGWEAEAQGDGVQVDDAIWVSFAPPDLIRVAVDIRGGFRIQPRTPPNA